MIKLLRRREIVDVVHPRDQRWLDRQLHCLTRDWRFRAVGDATRPLESKIQRRWVDSRRKQFPLIPRFELERKKRPATGAGLVILAGGARTARAGKAGSALTWGTVTLVIAPEEHPLPVGLGSKRAARVGEPIWVHATTVTEALHVPLHLERSCCTARARAAA